MPNLNGSNGYYSIGGNQGLGFSFGFPTASIMTGINEMLKDPYLTPEDRAEAERLRTLGNSKCYAVKGRSPEADQFMHWEAEDCEKFYKYAKELANASSKKDVLKILYSSARITPCASKGLSNKDYLVFEDIAFFKKFKNQTFAWSLGSCQSFLDSQQKVNEGYFKRAMYMGADSCDNFYGFANQLSLAAKQIQGKGICQTRERISRALQAAYPKMSWSDFYYAVDNAKDIIDRLGIMQQAIKEAKNGDADAARFINMVREKRKKESDAEHAQAQEAAREALKKWSLKDQANENDIIECFKKNKNNPSASAICKAQYAFSHLEKKTTGGTTVSDQANKAGEKAIDAIKAYQKYKYAIWAGGALLGLGIGAIVLRPYMMAANKALGVKRRRRRRRNRR